MRLPVRVSQVEDDGDEEVLSCVGGRSFRSRRERWWYIALSKCGVSSDLRPVSTGGRVDHQAVATATDHLGHADRFLSSRQHHLPANDRTLNDNNTVTFNVFNK